MIIPAAYAQVLDNGRVRCRLCPANCILTEGKAGICGCRYNHHGELVTDNFGELVSAAYDPIEKKPLYHFYPGSVIFSTGPNGCNLRCQHCQNWEISQTRVRTQYISPDDLVILAGKNRSIGIAYTYSEPLIWFEYIMDAATKIKKAGLKNVLVTNGYINPEPLQELLPVIDAANIDLKGINPEFYKRICKGKIEPILANIAAFFEAEVSVEITNLIITGVNDSERDITELIDFVAGISKTIPLHFSAYFPTYKMTRPPTPAETLRKAYDLARRKLDYVYLGNIQIPETSDTFCPSCGVRLIGRQGYYIRNENLSGRKCTNCGFDTKIRQ